MSKNIKIILISILLFALGAGVVNASAAGAMLTTNSQNIKPGETFEVVFTANCEEGINGIEAKISYDEDKLEFVKVEIVDATKWTNLGEGLTVQILNVSSESIKEGQIFKMTFKAKENVASGATANIVVDGIVIDTEAQTDSSKSVAEQTIKLNIIANEEPTQPETDNNTPDEEQTTDKDTQDKEQDADKDTQDKDQVADKETEDKEQIDDENKDSNVNKEETKDDKETNTKEESKKDNEMTTNSVSTSTNTKKDNTTASKEYPKTGAEIIVLPIALIAISLIASYIGYKKYKGI